MDIFFFFLTQNLMEKSSAYLTTVKKVDQNICSGTKNDRH